MTSEFKIGCGKEFWVKNKLCNIVCGSIQKKNTKLQCAGQIHLCKDCQNELIKKETYNQAIEDVKKMLNKNWIILKMEYEKMENGGCFECGHAGHLYGIQELEERNRQSIEEMKK